MIGIICAMNEEIEEIILLIKNPVREKVGPFEFVLGNVHGVKCVAVKCGVGKVHAATCTQTLIIKYNPDFVLNIGVAGSIDKNVNINDIVIASGVIQHDFDISAFPNRKKGEISGIDSVEIKCTPWISDKLSLCREYSKDFKTHRGVILSGDQFVNSSDKIHELKEEFGGIACEMEAGSIAQTCFINKVEFGILRAISDNANENSTFDFYSFIRKSSKNTADLLMNFVSRKDVSCRL